MFTEHTTVAVLPVLTGETHLLTLMKIWGIVLAGNLAGVYLFSFILATLPVSMNIIKPEAYEYIANSILNYPWYIIGGSSIMAGWLMGLLGWLITSSADTISRIFIIIIVTFVIGIAGLHHSIVGASEVITGALTSVDITYVDVFRFLMLAVAGNIIGGAIFVAALKSSNTNKKHFDVETET